MARMNVFVPLHNGAMLDFGPEVAGASNALAGALAGYATGDEYREGKEAYARELEQMRGEHPGVTAVLEAGGVLIPATAIAKLIRNGYGVAKVLQNQLQIRRGAKQLEKALRTQEYTDEPIFAGRMDQERIDAINEMLRKQGGTELESNKLLWPKDSQEHLYIKRIVNDKMNPSEVADIQKEVFFGKESKPYFNSEKHYDTGALQAPHEKGVSRGYVQNDGKGNTIGKTVFLRKRKR